MLGLVAFSPARIRTNADQQTDGGGQGDETWKEQIDATLHVSTRAIEFVARPSHQKLTSLESTW